MLKSLSGLVPSVPDGHKHSITEDKDVPFENARLHCERHGVLKYW